MVARPSIGGPHFMAQLTGNLNGRLLSRRLSNLPAVLIEDPATICHSATAEGYTGPLLGEMLSMVQGVDRMPASCASRESRSR